MTFYIAFTKYFADLTVIIISTYVCAFYSARFSVIMMHPDNSFTWKNKNNKHLRVLRTFAQCKSYLFIQNKIVLCSHSSKFQWNHSMMTHVRWWSAIKNHIFFTNTVNHKHVYRMCKVFTLTGVNAWVSWSPMLRSITRGVNSVLYIRWIPSTASIVGTLWRWRSVS